MVLYASQATNVCPLWLGPAHCIARRQLYGRSKSLRYVIVMDDDCVAHYKFINVAQIEYTAPKVSHEKAKRTRCDRWTMADKGKT